MDIEEPDNENSEKGSNNKKYSMEEQWPNEKPDIFQRMLELNISENQQRAGSDHHAKTTRRYNKRNDFRKILNSSSSNDRLIPSSLKNDSSRQNSERARNYFQTENSQDEESFRKSFKKRYDESFSVEMARDSSSEFSEKSWSKRSFHQILPPEYGNFKEEEIVDPDIEQKQICCNCKKSKCLKLYCQCFQRRLFCNKGCKCYDCGNHEGNEQHEKAVMQALARNAHGFEEQMSENDEHKGFSLGVEIDQVKKGCKCRKTHCVKKYCQCFNSGTMCGVFCRCEDCYNTKFHHNKIKQ